MKKSNYSFWLAITYEIVLALSDHYKALKRNKIIKMILDYCRHDWILWKVQETLSDVDKKAKEIVKEWEKEEPKKYTIIEHKPDGSKAQELLGGTLEIKSNFRRD
jgi:hypothetical protein